MCGLSRITVKRLHILHRCATVPTIYANYRGEANGLSRMDKRHNNCATLPVIHAIHSGSAEKLPHIMTGQHNGLYSLDYNAILPALCANHRGGANGLSRIMVVQHLKHYRIHQQYAAYIRKNRNILPEISANITAA